MKLFLNVLRTYRGNLTPQQYRTLRGQAIAGDIDGATKGLYRLMRRGEVN